jgi:hypothetical protein
VSYRKLLIALFLTLGLAPAPAAAQDWQMWIYMGGTIQKFSLSQIDSITYVLVDITPPANPVITAAPLDAHSIQVQWTAVGDDGNTGTAVQQELRYSSTPGLPFASMTPVAGLGPPQPAGTPESFTVGGLAPQVSYYFQLAVDDGEGHVSYSNVASALTLPDHLVIAEFFTSGGAAGASYDHDYVELFNPTAAPISLTNVSLQIVGGGGGGNWMFVALGGGTVPAHAYFLVELGAAGQGSGAPLPTPDATFPSLNLPVSTGKIALVASLSVLNQGCPPMLPPIIDFVGFGNAGCSEGPITVQALNSNQAGIRVGQGCLDTDNNGTDFVLGAPTPRNSTFTHTCP